MPSFIQRFIVLLLFLLQGFSPLVHAHVQSEGTESGLHIDGISVLVDKGIQLSSVEAVVHSDVVIGMSSAIEQEKLLDGEFVAYFPSTYTNDFIQPLVIEKVVGFSPHRCQAKLSPHLSTLAPRAPPYKKRASIKIFT